MIEESKVRELLELEAKAPGNTLSQNAVWMTDDTFALWQSARKLMRPLAESWLRSRSVGWAGEQSEWFTWWGSVYDKFGGGAMTEGASCAAWMERAKRAAPVSPDRQTSGQENHQAIQDAAHPDRRISQRRKEKDVTQVNMAIDYRKTDRRIAGTDDGEKCDHIIGQHGSLYDYNFIYASSGTKPEGAEDLFDFCLLCGADLRKNAVRHNDQRSQAGQEPATSPLQEGHAAGPATNLPEQPKHRRVVCAAIRATDGDVLLGIRHYSEDMHRQIDARRDGEKFAHRHDEDQGFVDQHGVFMSREEAWEVADLKGQIRDYDACGNGLNGPKLYSEGLY